MKILTLTVAVFCMPYALANETIYKWTDEQESLTNYGGIPPDDELGNNAVKVVNLQKGVITQLEFPTRDVDAAVEKNKELKLLAPPSSAAPAVASNHKVIGSSAPPAAVAAPEATNTKPQPQVLASGGSAALVVDPLESQKLNEQEAKLEEQAKSARRIAMEKRREEMKVLAERVRNGAASRKEIAALVTYRQTASFGEARSALARPKAAKKVGLAD